MRISPDEIEQDEYLRTLDEFSALMPGTRSEKSLRAISKRLQFAGVKISHLQKFCEHWERCEEKFPTLKDLLNGISKIQILDSVQGSSTETARCQRCVSGWIFVFIPEDTRERSAVCKCVDGIALKTKLGSNVGYADDLVKFGYAKYAEVAA